MKSTPPPPPQGANAEQLGEFPLAKGGKKPWAKPRVIRLTDGLAEAATGPTPLPLAVFLSSHKSTWFH